LRDVREVEHREVLDLLETLSDVIPLLPEVGFDIQFPSTPQHAYTPLFINASRP
jgi:hypothetical protein